MIIQQKIVIKSKHLFYFFQLKWKPYFLFTTTREGTLGCLFLWGIAPHAHQANILKCPPKQKNIQLHVKLYIFFALGVIKFLS
ncbi:hypothetical protein COK92_29645 [Bacillus anthracis]|nr:hypothetical protein COK92_29645 [Bacillus anthracis]